MMRSGGRGRRAPRRGAGGVEAQRPGGERGRDRATRPGEPAHRDDLRYGGFNIAHAEATFGPQGFKPLEHERLGPRLKQGFTTGREAGEKTVAQVGIGRAQSRHGAGDKARGERPSEAGDAVGMFV